MMVEKSGISYDGVKEWRQKYTGDKTWESFKTFFAREFREIIVQPKISIRRIWDEKHERRTRQRLKNQNSTATGGSASKFGHSDGSRQTGSGRAIHQQNDADT